MSNKQKQAERLYNEVARIALLSDVDIDEQIDWLVGECGMLKLFESYFSPKTTCPTCASLARAVMLDQAGKA